MIPVLMIVHIEKKGRKRFRLFLPVILIWIILFVLFLLLSPLVLVASLILWPYGYGKMLLAAGPLLLRVLCSLSGLGVQVENRDEKITVTAQ